MELKDFLKDTLTQIATGINETNKELTSLNSFVVSSNIWGEKVLSYIVKNDVKHLVTNIDFDIALTVTKVDSEKEGTKIGISVAGLDLGLGVGSEHKGENQNQTISKIRFSLPLALPTEPK